MSGESLSTLQALDLPARQLLAAPHLMIRVFKILSHPISGSTFCNDLEFKEFKL
jgi:hypothetical protein